MNDILELLEVFSTDDEDTIQCIERPRSSRFKDRALNHFDEWSDFEFLQRFRLSKKSVNIILRKIGNKIECPTQR